MNMHEYDLKRLQDLADKYSGGCWYIIRKSPRTDIYDIGLDVPFYEGDYPVLSVGKSGKGFSQAVDNLCEFISKNNGHFYPNIKPTKNYEN